MCNKKKFNSKLGNKIDKLFIPGYFRNKGNPKQLWMKP